MNLNKNIKLFITYLLGPILFIWLSYNIYHQIKVQPNLQENLAHIQSAFFTSKIQLFLLSIVLVFVNIGIEIRKWQLGIKQIQTISFKRAAKAVLSGMSFAISTPNRVGEYLGRVLFLNEGNKIKAIALTIVTSISQLLVTLIMGVLAFSFLKDKIADNQILNTAWLGIIYWGSIIILIIVGIIYFKISWITKVLEKYNIFKKFFWTIQSLEKLNATLLLRLLSLSVARYIIFTIQYYMLFRFFNVEVTLTEAWLGISIMFLVMTAIPSVAIFTDLGLKNEIIIKILGIYSSNSLGISLTSLTIWFINLIIPALIGAVFLIGIKKLFIKNNDENI